ncbi:MAG TPA: DUF1788 domain-containing protein [Methanoregulaceae archaeon]|nr:DUF1788 domain-containing protein [Methanoregulaceae archaeon]HNO08617.1 DUF1788 domain-containing protein [Methanoregulaceae archaeon]
MSKIDDLLSAYKNQVALPWTESLSAQEKIWFCMYDPSQERSLRKQLGAFAIVTQESGHIWLPLDITGIYDQWLATNEYKEEYFKNPSNLKYEENTFLEYFSEYVGKLTEAADSSTVIAVIGIGSLYGIIRVSKVLEHFVKTIPVPGRLLVFFPGERDGKNYRLLKARDGWNYLATPIEAPERD